MNSFRRAILGASLGTFLTGRTIAAASTPTTDGIENEFDFEIPPLQSTVMLPPALKRDLS